MFTANNTQETDGMFSIRASFDMTPSYTDGKAHFKNFLHSMMMSANTLMSPNMSMIHDYTQGCMDSQTIVLWLVTLIVVVMATLFVAVVCAWLTLVVMVHSRTWGSRAERRRQWGRFRWAARLGEICGTAE